jgi:hypothetical protein
MNVNLPQVVLTGIRTKTPHLPRIRSGIRGDKQQQQHEFFGISSSYFLKYLFKDIIPYDISIINGGFFCYCSCWRLDFQPTGMRVFVYVNFLLIFSHVFIFAVFTIHPIMISAGINIILAKQAFMHATWLSTAGWRREMRVT